MPSDKYYPELNLLALKRRAHRWASLYPCIERIYLYLYDIDSEDDTYEYVIVFVAPDRTSNEYVDKGKLDNYYDWVDDGVLNIRKDVEKFYNEPTRMLEDEWMLFSITPSEAEDIDGSLNFHGDDPFINLESEMILFSRAKIDKMSPAKCFPELNTEHLERIVGRWVEQYSHRGMVCDSVILYRYDPGLLKQSTSSVRYAIVFNLDHNYKIASEDLKGIETAISSIIFDPYLWFAMDTGFFSNAETEGLPEIFRNNDFEFVYKNPRETFYNEWMLIPLFSGFEIPFGVRINEGQATIYSGSSTSFNPYRPPSKDQLQAMLLENRKAIMNGEIDSSEDIPHVNNQCDGDLQENIDLSIINDLEEKKIALMCKIGPEIEKFLIRLQDDLDGRDGSTIQSAKTDTLYNAAPQILQNFAGEYNFLMEEYVSDIAIYTEVINRRKKIITNILQKAIKKKLRSAWDHKKIKTTQDALMTQHNALRKDKFLSHT